MTPVFAIYLVLGCFKLSCSVEKLNTIIFIMSLLQFHCINVQENQFFKTDDVLTLLNVCYSNKRITFYNTLLLDMYELSVFWSTVQRQFFFSLLLHSFHSMSLSFSLYRSVLRQRKIFSFREK